MTPEQKARKVIDKMFSNAGWQVLDRNHYAPNISAVALEEGLLNGNLEADYLLFLNGKAVGVLEAKKESVDVSADSFLSDAPAADHPVLLREIADRMDRIFQCIGKDRGQFNSIDRNIGRNVYVCLDFDPFRICLLEIGGKYGIQYRMQAPMSAFRTVQRFLRCLNIILRLMDLAALQHRLDDLQLMVQVMAMDRDLIFRFQGLFNTLLQHCSLHL